MLAIGQELPLVLEKTTIPFVLARIDSGDTSLSNSVILLLLKLTTVLLLHTT